MLPVHLSVALPGLQNFGPSEKKEQKRLQENY
jgi:hypothetical protein